MWTVWMQQRIYLKSCFTKISFAQCDNFRVVIVNACKHISQKKVMCHDKIYQEAQLKKYAQSSLNQNRFFAVHEN